MSSSGKLLEGNDLASVAKYIQSERCKSIVFLVGAGLSTSAGIPDFRSPKTGLYANLARLNLPYPEAVFDIGYFRKNPLPFYTLARELFPGQYRPTLSHSFIHLVHKKGLLHTCFTQNIDTLERIAGLPDEKVVEAHGSFANQRCIDCQTEFDAEEMRRLVMEKKVVRCARKRCGGLVKPDIVFFGESLPERFFKTFPTIPKADLMIIIGTSLTVNPFATLSVIPDENTCPRVLINLEQVGDLGTARNDAVLLGKCDEVVRKLAKELGWEEELDALWEKTGLKSEAGKEENQQAAKEEVETLMTRIAESLELGSAGVNEPSKEEEAAVDTREALSGVSPELKREGTEDAVVSAKSAQDKEEPGDGASSSGIL